MCPNCCVKNVFKFVVSTVPVGKVFSGLAGSAALCGTLNDILEVPGTAFELCIKIFEDTLCVMLDQYATFLHDMLNS